MTTRELYYLKRKRASTSGYDVDSVNYFSRLPVSLSASQKNYINACIVGLKLDMGLSSLSDMFDILQIRGGVGHKSNALVNVIDNGIVPIEVNTLTWSNSEGLSSNGTTSYVNFSYNPSVSAINWSQDSACMFSYESNSGASQDGDICGASVAYNNGILFRNRRVATDGSYLTINSGGVSAVASPIPATRLISIVRTASNLITFYRNGVSYGTDNTASQALVNLALYGMCTNFNGIATAFRTLPSGVFGICRGTVDQVSLSSRFHQLAVDLGFSV